MKILLFVILSFKLLFSQQFLITDYPAEYISVDPHTQDIYFYNLVTGIIMKINTNNMIPQPTNFPVLPRFANNSHKAVYFKFHQQPTELFLYDFAKDTTILLGQLDTGYTHAQFSPNDTRLLIGPGIYYSFEGDSFHNPGIPRPPMADTYQDLFFWGNDDETIFYNVRAGGGPNPNYIIRYRYDTNVYDTLATITWKDELISKSYNSKKNILAYSYFNHDDYDTYLRFIYLDEKRDSLIFNTATYDPECYTSTKIFDNLKWSPDKEKLIFFGKEFVGHPESTPIYLHILQDSTYRLTQCFHEGVKYYMEWLNNDTVCYMIPFELYGFDVTSALVPVSEEDYEIKETFFEVFPNPFNNEVAIKFRTEAAAEGKIRIFDITGMLIKEIHFETYGADEQIVKWDGRNDKGMSVASGTYLINATIELTGKKKFNDTIKVIYLK